MSTAAVTTVETIVMRRTTRSCVDLQDLCFVAHLPRSALMATRPVVLQQQQSISRQRRRRLQSSFLDIESSLQPVFVSTMAISLARDRARLFNLESLFFFFSLLLVFVFVARVPICAPPLLVAYGTCVNNLVISPPFLNSSTFFFVQKTIHLYPLHLFFHNQPHSPNLFLLAYNILIPRFITNRQKDENKHHKKNICKRKEKKMYMYDVIMYV